MMNRYQFGIYEETPDGRRWVEVMAPKKCEADCQAEAEAESYCLRNKKGGIYVKRSGCTWFVRSPGHWIEN